MRWITILLVSSFTLGCTQTDPATDLLKTYADRTSRAIDVDFDLKLNSTAQMLAPLPPRRDRTLVIEEINEGLLDVLDLRQCGLIDLIAQRNTSLGKLAPGSQRLIYELSFFPKLRLCIENLKEDPEQTKLLSRLQTIATQKIDNLPKQIWNSVYTSAEIEQHFSLGSPPLPPSDTSQVAPLQLTLDRFSLIAGLNQKTDWQAPEFVSSLERDYETLYRSEFGSQWLTSMVYLTQTLDQTAQAIEQRLEGRPICFNQQQNRKSEILWNVFVKFYVNSLQPYLAGVERDGRIWSSFHMEMVKQLKLTEQAWIETYFADTGALWEPYLLARKRHTNAWQSLLEQCGLRPGV